MPLPNFYKYAAPMGLDENGKGIMKHVSSSFSDCETPRFAYNCPIIIESGISPSFEIKISELGFADYCIGGEVLNAQRLSASEIVSQLQNSLPLGKLNDT